MILGVLDTPDMCFKLWSSQFYVFDFSKSPYHPLSKVISDQDREAAAMDASMRMLRRTSEDMTM